MSFQRLHNVSRRYGGPYPGQEPYTPITARRFSDETDIDSIATSVSDDTVSDHDSRLLIDRRARDLRRRDSQARLDNTLQVAQDRIRNGISPAQDLANGATKDGGHLYNDVARPLFGEVIFKIRVAVTVIWRLFLRLFIYILELPDRIVWYTLDKARDLFFFVLFLISASFWVVLDFARASFGYIMNLLRRSFLAIFDLVDNFPLWTMKPIAMAIVSLMLAISILHGFKSMATYICNDADVARRWTAFPDVCEHPNLNAVLDFENTEVAELVETSNIIVHSIADLVNAAKPDPNPGQTLITESQALLEFVETHQGNLARFSQGHDIVSVAKQIHGNITTFNWAVGYFETEHTVRILELEQKINRILATAKKFSADSPAERFFSESMSYFIPSVFTHSRAARVTSDYVTAATRFVGDHATISIKQHAVQVSQSTYNAAYGLQIAKQAIVAYEPYWKFDCQNHDLFSDSDVARCHQDPLKLNKRLGSALENFQASAALIAELDGLHRVVVDGMGTLRADLISLLKDAQKHKTGEMDAASARAILHDFVAQVGALDISLRKAPRVDDEGVIGLKFEGGVARGSKWTRLPNGELVPISAHPYWHTASIGD